MNYLSRLMWQNRWFFASFVLFLIVAGIILIFTNHGDEIYFFSNNRTYYTDVFFRAFTNVGDGSIFVLAFIILLFWRYRTAATIFLLGISVFLTSASTKRIFSEPRPYRYFEERNLLDKITFVEGVHIVKGTTSLPSGHTMVAFAFFTFLALVLPQKKWIGFLLFVAALLVGISRMYLVQHFLSDVYLGSITGVMLAIIFHFVHSRYFNYPWADQALLPKKKTLPEV